MKPNIYSNGRIPSLDGLRAMSICLVIVGHASATVAVFSHSASTLFAFIGAGRLGVSVFFVISGFLITKLLAREQQAAQSIDLKAFYIRRMLRIFPAFYCYWLVVLALTLLGCIHVPRLDLVSSAVYIWNYVPRKVDSWFLGHTWSLSLEEQFYLLWPFILFLSGPKRGKWIAFGIVVFAPFLRVASYFLFPSTRPLIGMMLHTRADSLMIGSLLALVMQERDHIDTIKRWAQSSLIPVGALCFVAVDTILSVRFRGEYLLPVGYTLQNLLIALLVAHVVFYDQTSFGKILSIPSKVIKLHSGFRNESQAIHARCFPDGLH